MGGLSFGIPKKSNTPNEILCSAHTEAVFAHNLWMKKMDIRQLLTRRLNEEMERAGINQQTLAGKAGISVSHLSEIRRGISSITVDLLDDLGAALGVDAWELIIDEEETRRQAIERAVSRPPFAASEPRPKAVAHRTRKKRPKSGSSRGESP